MIAEFGGCVISVSHDRLYISDTSDVILRLCADGLHEIEKS